MRWRCISPILLSCPYPEGAPDHPGDGRRRTKNKRLWEFVDTLGALEDWEGQPLRQFFLATWRFLGDILRAFALRIVILTLALASIAVGLEAWFWFGRPPIVRGLSGTFFLRGVPDAGRVYQERVKSAFPIRMAESDLLRDLHNQGFTDPVPRNDKKYVKFEEGSFPCLLKWMVIWRTDEAGALSEVKGELGRSCL
jgi:hypothetical protein